MRKFVPAYEGNLRKHALSVPRCISECSGIRVFGRRIKSLVFSTVVAIIKNINADAIIAVYPFTPQPAITQAIIGVSEVPVCCGVGGGLTNGVRSASMAAYVEHQGARYAGHPLFQRVSIFHALNQKAVAKRFAKEPQGSGP